MSGFKKLERVEQPATPKEVSFRWTLGHSLIFLGGLVIFFAVASAMWLLWSVPSDPYANFTPEGMMQAAQTRTPVQSLRLWQLLEKSGYEHHKRGSEIAYEEEQAKHNVLWWVWALIPVTGLGLVAAGLVVLSLKKKRLIEHS